MILHPNQASIRFDRHAATGSEVRHRRGKDGKLSVRTVFMSDVHLGTRDSKAREAAAFLKHVECEKLVLNGDIIDAWSLRRGAKWSHRHTKFVRTVLKMSEQDDLEVIYLRGNHDDILDRFLPLAFGSIRYEEFRQRIAAPACRQPVTAPVVPPAPPRHMTVR